MNLVELLNLGDAFRTLSDDEMAALHELVEGTPVTITASEAALMKKGVEQVLKPAALVVTGVTTLEDDVDDAIANYESANTSEIEIGVTVLINLTTYPVALSEIQTAQIVWDTDMDAEFPLGYSHLLITEPLFSDGLPDIWTAVVEADIVALQGSGKFVVFRGMVGFNDDGTENVSYTPTGEFYAVTADHLRTFALLPSATE